MKKTLLTLIIVSIFGFSVYSQSISISSMIKLLNYNRTQTGDYLVAKNFVYAGNEKKVSEYLISTPYYWAFNYKRNINSADAWVSKSKNYKNDGSDGLGQFLYDKVTYQTFSASNYLILKNELKALQFKLIKEDDFEGDLVSIHENSIYKITIFISSTNNSYEISLKKK